MSDFGQIRVIADPEAFCKERLPTDVLRGIFKTLNQCYVVANDRVKVYTSATRQDFFGQTLWAVVKDELLGLQGAFPGVVQTRTVWNRRGTQSYTQIRIGQIVLTPSKISKPDTPPRPAVFRSTLLLTSQNPLIDDGFTFSDDEPLYGIITHGIDENDTATLEPSFVNISFRALFR